MSDTETAPINQPTDDWEEAREVAEQLVDDDDTTTESTDEWAEAREVAKKLVDDRAAEGQAALGDPATNFTEWDYAKDNAAAIVGDGGEPPPEEVAPVLSALNPTSITAAAAAVPVTVTGTGFTAASVVAADGVDQPTTFVDETSVTFDASAPVAGTVSVTVSNAAGASNALSLTVA